MKAIKRASNSNHAPLFLANAFRPTGEYSTHHERENLTLSWIRMLRLRHDNLPYFLSVRPEAQPALSFAEWAKGEWIKNKVGRDISWHIQKPGS